MPASDAEVRDILIASLTDVGFEGFEENENELIAYIPKPDFSEAVLDEVLTPLQISRTTETIQEQNWNAQWEENFQPIIIDDYCTIRAHFHTLPIETPYEIVITPKMSFGTGHHATTQLMLLQMRGMDLSGKTILDFGTGTGILAIMAEKLGAAGVLALDNDAWSVENAIENAERNLCKKISVKLASQPVDGAEKSDIILANINRHILLEHMQALHGILNDKGVILMSGLLKEDETIIVSAATKAGFKKNKVTELNNWISILFEKI